MGGKYTLHFCSVWLYKILPRSSCHPRGGLGRNQAPPLQCLLARLPSPPPERRTESSCRHEGGGGKASLSLSRLHHTLTMDGRWWQDPPSFGPDFVSCGCQRLDLLELICHGVVACRQLLEDHPQRYAPPSTGVDPTSRNEGGRWQLNPRSMRPDPAVSCPGLPGP